MFSKNNFSDDNDDFCDNNLYIGYAKFLISYNRICPLVLITSSDNFLGLRLSFSLNSRE